MASTPYLERYRQLGTLDQQKNQLIEVGASLVLLWQLQKLIICAPRQDLLQRVTDLETSFAQEKLDHERETRFNRDIQLHEMELMQQISQIKTIMVSARGGMTPRSKR
jgi:hypothetical protein